MKNILFEATDTLTSSIGLGTGGFSRLGTQTHGVQDRSIEVIQTALDLGISFFDTAESYGTEELLGKGLCGSPRDRLTLCSKFSYQGDGGRLRSPGSVRESCQRSIDRLGTSYLDVLYIHGVSHVDYPLVRDTHLPMLETLRKEGLVRAVGITEPFSYDTEHTMLRLAMQDDCWDVMMIGYNVINHTSGSELLEQARRAGVSTVGMFAVRRALRSYDSFEEYLLTMSAMGRVPRSSDECRSFVSFLKESEQGVTLPSLAYRFCLQESGLDIILMGTGSRDHLIENITSSMDGEETFTPLDPVVTSTIREFFSGVSGLSGQE